MIGRIVTNGAVRVIAVCVASVVALAVAGCRDTPAAFGPDPALARVRASELLEALANDHTRVTRTAVLETSSRKLVNAALIPSRVWGDRTVWTTIKPDSTRVLTATGHFVGDRYLLAELVDPPRPERLGDQRHLVRLNRIGPNDYEWGTSVEVAIGSLTPDDVDRVVSAVLAAAATTPGEALRLGSETTFPRATAALARLFSLDTVRTIPVGDGSASVTLVFGLHPDRLKSVYPAFASYLARYTGPTRMHYVLSDVQGNTWFDVELAGGVIGVRFRSTHDGHLAPATGPVHAMPDSLLLRTDFHTKLWLLSIGIVDLVSDFSLLRSEHARGWHFAFRHEPKWHLPLGVNVFVTSALRRPFEGEGAEFNIAVRDTAGASTLIARDGHFAVRESTIMRWFGGLGTQVYSDFSGPSELQQYAFIADAMTALRADLDDATAAASTGDVTPDAPAATRP